MLINSLFLLSCLPIIVHGVWKNVCTSWKGYTFMSMVGNCYHDPDVFSTTPEIIERHIGKGSCQNYTVTTKDGYILTLFRIVRKNPEGVVILQHPVTCDGVVWVLQGNESLAFTLWNLGYEVWLPNHRGTHYSAKHLHLTINDIKYWQFTFHEIGIYDYPLFAEKVSEISKSTEIIFVGNSMASTSALVYASLLPKHIKKYIKILILMSPAVFLKHVRSPLKFFCPFEYYLRRFSDFLGIGSFFTTNSLSWSIVRKAVYFPYKLFSVAAMYTIAGWTPSQFDPKLYNLAFSEIPRGTPLHVVYHYSQIFNNGGEFKLFDYGRSENFRRYNSIVPPSYPLENVEIPTYLITSTSDALATAKDGDILYKRLPNVTKIYGRHQLTGLSHIDYYFGKDRYKLAYNYILNLIKKVSI